MYGESFGKRLRMDFRAKTRPLSRAYPRLSGADGFGKMAGCQISVLSHHLVDSWHSRSARKSLYYVHSSSASARSPGGLEEAHLPSRASLSAMLQPEAATSNTALPLHSGTLNVGQNALNMQKLAVNETLRKYVQDRLGGEITNEAGKQVGPQLSWSRRRHGPRQDRGWATSWSPEQIANRLRIDFPEDESMRVSHEAIYQALYIEGRGALKRECSAFLRSGPPLRVPRARVKARGKHFVTPDVLIDQRPKNVEARDTPGHWEGDLIIGLESSAIGTLVERSTRFTMLLHLPRMAEHGKAREKNGLALAGHGAYAVRMAITDAMLPLPPGMRQSLTWDQGAEMAQHVRVKEATGMQIYFCEPRSPWQRGTNENTNGLLRQYFPKGTDLGRYSAQDLAAVTVALNNRPRKVLGCRTPAEVFAHHLSCANSSVATTG